MKIFFLILFTLASSVCFAQFRKADKTTPVKQDSIALTQWQQEQITQLENQKKALDEKINFLIRAILDFNKIEENSLGKLEYQQGKLIVTRRKDE